jgi:predicted RecA/RadA family phage recombinase
MKKLFVLLLGLVLLAAYVTTTAASAAATKYEGVFVPKEYTDLFEPGAEKHTLRWIKPGVDHAKYSKFMVDYVVFALAPDSDYKGIDADEMKQLADAASLAVVNAIQEKYSVVSEPGPDVARVRFAIVDLKQSRPGVSAVTSVVPAGIGISLLKIGATGKWAGSGMTKGEVMVLDSTTNEVLAAGYADYAAKFTERFSKWGSVEEAFKYWGGMIADQLTRLREGKQ